MRCEYADRGRGPVGFDCWGFVRMVESEQFGIDDLPDLAGEYTSAEDHGSVALAVGKYERALAASWGHVSAPESGDIVILNIGGRPWHCGVAAGNGDWMMHILKDVNVSLERIDREPWRNRVEGIYRHLPPQNNSQKHEDAAFRAEKKRIFLHFS